MEITIRNSQAVGISRQWRFITGFSFLMLIVLALYSEMNINNYSLMIEKYIQHTNLVTQLVDQAAIAILLGQFPLLSSLNSALFLPLLIMLALNGSFP